MYHPFSRREFLLGLSGLAARFAGIGYRAGDLLPASSGPPSGARGLLEDRSALRLAPPVRPDGLTLQAAVGSAEIGGGLRAPAWLLNDSLPSPLLEVRRGQRFRITLRNDLPDDLILHWHGLTPPEHSDGHPRFAVRTGELYEYDFSVEDRAGTYWYHSHTHHRTAMHTALGIAGMVIVRDEEEDALRLPAGEREIPLILQDRQLDSNGLPFHTYANLMSGYLGREAFGNGIWRPFLDCDTALYRFRILNGANARIFRLERSDGEPLVLIGNDGGLIDRSRRLSFIDVAPAERVDLLVDLRSARVGDRIMLRSREFPSPGGSEELLKFDPQGIPMDLLQLRVTNRVADDSDVPDVLSSVSGPRAEDSVRERTFEFGTGSDAETRSMVMHTINDAVYDLERIDVRVPFDQTEIWSLRNDNRFAHPIHLHGTHFRILSRTSGRGEVMPWEGGLKDTVLLYPSETVRIAVRFTANRGLFLLHCHNLEHEDTGMMVNVMVE